MPVVGRLFDSESPEERNSKVVLGQVNIKKEDEEGGGGDNTDINSSDSMSDDS